MTQGDSEMESDSKDTGNVMYEKERACTIRTRFYISKLKQTPAPQ